MQDIMKFIGHIIFISLCISLGSWLVSLVYGSLFYFGFVNTIVGINIIGMLSMSGIMRLFSSKIYAFLSGSYIGNKLLNLFNNYYNIYVGLKRYMVRICNYFVKWLRKLWVYTKLLFGRFRNIHGNLAGNTKSISVRNTMYSKYNTAQSYLFFKMFNPSSLNLFTNILNTDPFHPKRDTLSDQYKNPKSNQGINMNFLTNTQLNETNDDDDLDDNLDDTETIIHTEQEPEQEKIVEEKPVEPIELDKPLTKAEKRAALKRKIAEKRANRTGVTARNAKQMQQNMEKFSNIPDMNDMMKTMMQGDNLEKIMKQVSLDKLGMSIPNMTPAQIQQLAKEMKKK